MPVYCGTTIGDCTTDDTFTRRTIIGLAFGCLSVAIFLIWIIICVCILCKKKQRRPTHVCVQPIGYQAHGAVIIYPNYDQSSVSHPQ